MNREEVLQILRTHQQELKDLGVRSLELFGSVARNEARSDSRGNPPVVAPIFIITTRLP
ncbi:MAG: hypothetical protein V6D39_04800 [Dolichospermum lemmermannii FEM_B0920]